MGKGWFVECQLAIYKHGLPFTAVPDYKKVKSISLKNFNYNFII